MKKYFKYFVYISIIFLIVALYKANYLNVPVVYSVSAVLFAICILCIGFILEAITWQKTLKIMAYETSLKDSIISIGLSIFGKYIPGKIWLIAGRSAYISQKRNYSEKELLSVSTITQIISLWVGIIFGMIGLLFLEKVKLYGFLAFVLWLILTLILFTKYPHKIFLISVRKIFKKELKIPFINFWQILKVLPWFIVRWIFFVLSFYFLVFGLYNAEVPYFIGLGYPLAGTLGLVVIFVPGGLGIREGILASFLILSGFAVDIATTISVASRLWFLAGEVFIFLLAILLSRIKKSN